MSSTGLSTKKLSTAVRIAIVDDHDMAREGLREMLADVPDIEVIGEASNGREALGLCARLRPDIVLMDVRMPEMDGLLATSKLKQDHPEISVLMVTMHENPEYLFEALKAGAAGYVLKDASRQEVITAVRQVRNGESPLDQDLASRLLRRIASESASGSKPSGRETRYRFDKLTRRELEVLGLLKEGMTNRQIAGALFVSPGTAKNHVEHIITKLGVSDRTQAVVRALEIGIIDFAS